jgi:hypothetical protein
MVEETAATYDVSVDTLYRALRERSRPVSAHRLDKGKPRKLSRAEMERYCEVIAAFKIRTCNKKGRHISTARAIELLEEYGMETPHGLVKPAKGLLTRPTVNRYLKAWGYDHDSMTRQPAAVRFQAENSNDCWHFDLSPSDLKQISLIGSAREYIEWLLDTCTAPETKIVELIEDAAIELLAVRLRTPLQIQQHLTLAMEATYEFGEKTVTTAIVESVLSKQIDDLEPTLTRHGYNVKGLAEQFSAKPAEIRLLFRGQLDPNRTRELHEQMLAAGLPI